MKTRLFLVGLSLCLMDGFSQTQDWCGSNQLKNQYYKEHPQNYQQVKESKNKLLQDASEAHRRYELGFQTPTHAHSKQAAADGEYRIPVVFHIMHEEKDENITYEQVLDQLRIMNEDFARLNPDAVNTPEHFVARKDSVNFELIADPVSSYSGQNSFITFQAGTDNELTNGLGQRYTYYITTEESPLAPNFEALLPSAEEVNYQGATETDEMIDIAFGTITEIDGNSLGNRIGIIKALAEELNATGQFEATEIIDGLKEVSTVDMLSSSLDILTQQEAYLTAYNGANQASSFYFTKAGNNEAPITAPGNLYAVAIDGLSTQEEIAAALQAVIDAQDDFDATLSGNSIEIQNTLEGSADDISPSGLLNASISKMVTTQGVITDNLTSPISYGARMVVHNLQNGAASQRIIGLTDLAVSTEIMKGGFIAAATKISFELARLDPDGNCTSGINRVYTRKTIEARDQIKSLIQWDPYSYLNVWVVGTIENLAGNGITLGYAQFPEDLTTRTETDGLVIRHDYLGSIGTASSQIGRTASHEIGHWLGLRHIWGDDDYDPIEEQFFTPPFTSADLEIICGSDDGVADTPLQGDRSSGCNDFPVASDCHDLWYGDMFMNYMDYSDDVCMNLFTRGQEAVMVQTLETIRANIWSTENLIATGLENFNEASCAPHIVDIQADDRWVCEGTTIDFEAEVYFDNASSTYEWNFAGASTTSSTDKTPSITYDTPGIYETSLTVSNGSNASVKTRKQMIHVISDNPPLTSPLTEGFAQWQFPDIEGKPFLLSHQGEGAIGQWEYAANVNGNYSPEQMGSIRARTMDFNSDEPRYIAFPNIDLSDISGSIYLEFEYAQAAHNLFCDDHLNVRLLGGCDANSQSVPLGGGPTEGLSKDLSYAAGDMGTSEGNYVFFDYVPDADDWKTARMKFNLGNPFKSNTTLYFELFGNIGAGNYIYLDNITIGTELDIEDITATTIGLQVYPNPTSDHAVISFQLNKNANVSIGLYDVIGKQIGFVEQKLGAEQHQINLSDLSSHLNAGVYLIQVNVDGVLSNKKIIISD